MAFLSALLSQGARRKFASISSRFSRRRSDVIARPRADDRVIDLRTSEILTKPASSASSSSSAPKEVIVRDAYKEDTSIVIKWDSETSNILGFRVVFRYVRWIDVQYSRSYFIWSR